MAIQGKRLFNFILIPALMALVGAAAFGLGRLSVLKESKGSLVIHSASQQEMPTNGTHD